MGPSEQSFSHVTEELRAYGKPNVHGRIWKTDGQVYDYLKYFSILRRLSGKAIIIPQPLILASQNRKIF